MDQIERTFGRIKDWRRAATGYDRYPEMFLSACAFATIVKFWLYHSQIGSNTGKFVLAYSTMFNPPCRKVRGVLHDFERLNIVN